MRTRIVVFDDNKNIRNSITLLLETDPAFEVVGSFGDATQCVERVVACKADIVLMDIEMPEVNGVEAVKRIKKEIPTVQILVQTVFDDEDIIFDSIRAGASGYVLKSALTQSLIGAVHDLRSGGAPMTPWAAKKVLNMIYTNTRIIQPGSVDYKLTPKETQVLACIVKGLSYKMVGAELNITYETVRSHVKKIYEKLHVASLTEVVAKAIYEQIV